MSTSTQLILSCSCLLLTAACTSDTNKPGGAEAGVTPSAESGSTAESGAGGECPVVVADKDCDKTQRPFVFVHGTYGSGDNFAHVAALLTSNGFCPERIVAVEYNSLGEQPGTDCAAGGTPKGCGNIDTVVDRVLKETGFSQVDIAGHSQG